MLEQQQVPGAITRVVIAGLRNSGFAAITLVVARRVTTLVTNMLPALNDQGDLPPGIHVAGFAEVEQRFGTGSRARVLAFATLRRLHDLARRTGSLRNFYVFGSFVSSIPEPRDVDVVLFMAHGFAIENCPWESRPLFYHGQAQARYGASVFWIREQTMTEAENGQFIRAWQEKRDGTLRGILELA